MSGSRSIRQSLRSENTDVAGEQLRQDQTEEAARIFATNAMQPTSNRMAGVTHASRSFAAIEARWTRDSAFIFCITLPRCAFTVISLMPNSHATCLFSRPETTSAITSRSRRLSVRVAVAKHPHLRLVTKCGAAALDGVPDCAQQHVVAEWLRQELDRPRLHCPDRHRHVAVPGDEDDRHVDPIGSDALLQIETVEARED